MKRKMLVIAGSLLVLVMLGVGCQPNPGEDPTEARLEQACADWCAAAVPCSTYYAEQQQFNDRETCEASCQSYADMVHEQYGDTCVDVVLDDRECAADLTCEEFVAYEEYSFSEPPSITPPPCAEEVLALINGCDI
jgi:hypothetical protein